MKQKDAVLSMLVLLLLSLVVACGGSSEPIQSCEDQFQADSTAQQFIQQLEQAIEDRDCAAAQNIYSVFELTSQPYQDCPPIVSRLAELDSAYQDLQATCDSDRVLNSMQATISGAISGVFEAESPVAGQPLVITTLDSTNFSIIGTDVISISTSYQIAFNLSNYTGSGTYPISVIAGNTAIFSQVVIDLTNPTEPEILPFAGLSGSLEITELDSAYRGNFNFTGVNSDFQTVQVTEGQFFLER